MLARRRTIEPSIVQGLVSCRKCGYALSRTSTRSSARKIHYYRCIGSDGWRHLGGPLCNNRPVRQDLLDQIVWTEVIRLLEDPTLIQQELDRRLAAARAADPTKQREQTLERELVRVGKGIERLLTAYQEDLLSLEQLRERMPPLRQREQALRAELQSIADQTRERATYLHLAETLTAFLARLRVAADTLDIVERQRIVRLVIKEVLVGDDTIVIRHCIPAPSGPPHGSGPAPSGHLDGPGAAEVTFCVRGVISPLLANIYLDVLDLLWERQCRHLGELVRYADDAVVLCQSKADAEESLRRLGLIMDRLGLKLHPDKTRIVELGLGKQGFVFLGCYLRIVLSHFKGREYLFRWPSPRAMTRIRARIRELTQRRRWAGLKDIRQVIDVLNPVSGAGATTSARGTPRWKFQQVDRYVNERLVRLLRHVRGWRRRPFSLHEWSPARFAAELGLYRLVGTIRYPGQVNAT